MNDVKVGKAERMWNQQIRLNKKTGGMILGAAGLLALCLVVQSKAQPAQNNQDTRAAGTVFAMDTVITLEAYGGQSTEAVQSAETLIEELDGLWSVTREVSEIYQVNHSQGNPVMVSDKSKILINRALQLAADTGGALNPAIYPIVKAWGFTTGEYRVPEQDEVQQLLKYTDYRDIELRQHVLKLPEHMEVDFGAIAKGYSGDLLADTLRAHGVSSGIINLGGNVALIGDRPDGTAWRVGIRSPYGEGNMGVLEASDCHIITSGGYERYFTGEDGTIYWHIMDPATGSPANSGIISATIVGTEGWRCDGLSTAVFVMGLEEAVQYWKVRDGFEMILVTEENKVCVTEGLEEAFCLNEASKGIPLHIIYR